MYSVLTFPFVASTATIKNERQLYKERHEAAVDLLNYHITTEDVLRVRHVACYKCSCLQAFMQCGALHQVFTKLGVELQREIAEEMLFDADLHGTGVNYYALITYVRHWFAGTCFVVTPAISVSRSDDSHIEYAGLLQVHRNAYNKRDPQSHGSCKRRLGERRR